MPTAGIVENPLPTEGVVGYLTEEQEEKLKQGWLEFLQLADKAPEEGSGSAGGKKDSKEDKDLGKDIPKDDKAKAERAKQIELKEARAALEQYGSKRFMKTFWGFMLFDNPDTIMLRFLRARKWDVGAGVAMLAACMKWRIESGIEDLFFKGEEGNADKDGYLRQFETGKTYTQGTDRQGRPVVYIHVALHKTSGQPPAVMEEFVLSQMEVVRCMLADRAEKVTMIFDMTKFGLANMDWRVILLLVKCLESYYPESLNAILIHNAPFVFQGIWKILGPMLDPVVRAKVQMTRNTEDLCVHISKEHLVKKLGGENEFQWEFIPVKPGENEKQEDEATRKKMMKHRNELIAKYEEVTRKWAKSDDEVTRLIRSYLCDKMRVQWFHIDPYVRGRTVYHRNGSVIGNGLVHFSYPGTPGGDEWQVIGYERSLEGLTVRMDRTKAEIKAAGGKVPVFSWEGGRDGGDDAKPARRKSTSSRR